MIPNGLDYVEMLKVLSEKARQGSESKNLDRNSLRAIGSALSALYQAGSCHRACHGGPHVLEALAGRAHNLGCAAYLLIARGFYDEALNLVRSLGEISNLILLSVVDKDAHARWLAADHATRLRDFSPAKVRQLVYRGVPGIMYADQDWYSSFCEKFTHVTPATKPNSHNDEGRSIVGGIFQPGGLSFSQGELATVLVSVALPVCRYFNFNDLFDELVEAVR